ncbi:putative glycoside hydrolase [Erysiphe neolycopersici]|uniref:Putative glycoside hydrolase n=1 Tax=Erysiphe neolycopersici TaxID=212602 RepID=A0A420I740_9PEZI|nr:putative glycoside hydrolase [Erysiphe neolycopersici]
MILSLPPQALGVSILVFIFSLGCLMLSSLLVCLLIKCGEKYKYVTLFSGFSVLSTFASIIHQIHYVANWKDLRMAHYQQAVESYQRHGIAFGGVGETWDVVLFYFQFYCYNVMVLNILFWAISLFNSCWASTYPCLGERNPKLAIFSKFFSVIWPMFIVIMSQLRPLQYFPILHVVCTYSTIFYSLSMGSILLILILYKYMETRKLASEHDIQDDDWWTQGTSDLSEKETIIGSYGKISHRLWNRKRYKYDKALVTRFTIGFVIMGIFQILIITLTLYRVKSNESIVKSGEPDMSASNAIIESLLFLPGVSSSLIAFLVFGTTKPWSDYRDLLFGAHSGYQSKSPYFEEKTYNASSDETSYKSSNFNLT